MASKITYDDKISQYQSPLNPQQKISDEDMNEIKKVVNENAEELESNTLNMNSVIQSNTETKALVEELEEQVGNIAEPTIIKLDSEKLTNIILDTSKLSDGNHVEVQFNDGKGHIICFDGVATNTYYVNSSGIKTPLNELLDLMMTLIDSTALYVNGTHPKAKLEQLKNIMG